MEREQEKEILENIMRCKFEQNANLRKKLVMDTCTKFYEMTNDKYWGTGTRITAEMKTVEVESLVGKNTTGEILNVLKEEFSQWDESWSDCSSFDWESREKHPAEHNNTPGELELEATGASASLEE